MMRLDLPTSFWIALVLSAAHGCKGTGGPQAVATDTTSGGEVSGVPTSGTGDGDAAADEAAQSPWGATRAEQCRRPARPGFSQRAAKDLAEGARAAEANDLDEAKEHFQSALKRDAGAYPALYNLGVLADRRGDEARAIDQYRRALALVPDYEPAARGIATIHLRNGESRRAIEVVEPLANEYRANLELQALYAEILVESKRFEEAWMAARRALKCDEKFVPALIALTKASRAQGREELADSILDQALEIDPKVAELHFLDGERLKGEPGRLRESMAAYQRAVQLRPDYAEARMALGIQLLAGGNYESALDHFKSAKQLVPTLPAVHVNLGDAYRATEQWTEAQAAYRQALSLQSPLPEAHYGLGLMFLTAADDFPGLDELTAYQKAVEELQTYRAEMGARLSKDDQSTEYLQDLDRMIKRTRRRMEREQGGTS